MSLRRRVVLVAALTGAFIAAAVPTIGTGATTASAAKPANSRVVVNRYIPNPMLAHANDKIVRTKGNFVLSHKTVCLLGK
jgi:hypothetical protein